MPISPTFLSSILRVVLALVLASIMAIAVFSFYPVNGVRSDVIVVFKDSVDGSYAQSIAANAQIIADSAIRERKSNQIKEDSIDAKNATMLYAGSSSFGLETYGSDLREIVKENRTALNDVLRALRTHYGPSSEMFFDVVGNAYEVTKWKVLLTTIATSILLGWIFAGLLIPRRFGYDESSQDSMESGEGIIPAQDTLPFKNHEAFGVAPPSADDSGVSVMGEDTSKEDLVELRNKLSHGKSRLAEKWGSQSAAQRLFVKKDEKIEASENDHEPEGNEWIHDEWDEANGSIEETIVLPEIEETVIALDDQIVESPKDTGAKKERETKKSTQKKVVDHFGKNTQTKSKAQAAPGNLPIVDMEVFSESLHEDNVAFNAMMHDPKEPEEKTDTVQDDDVDFESEESHTLTEEKKSPTVETAVTEINADVPEPTDEELKKRLNKLLRGEI